MAAKSVIMVANASKAGQGPGIGSLVAKKVARMDARTSTAKAAPRDPNANGDRSAGRQQQILEAFVAQCQASLFKETGARAREFLTGYGFPTDRLAQTPVGVFPGANDVREHLRAMGFSAAEIKAFSPAMAELSPGWLVGPVNDARGRLATFFACDPGPAGHGGAQYLFLRTGAEVPAICLDAALSREAGGAEDLVLVENLLDVLLLHAHGFGNVAGICDAGRQFSSRRWEALGKLGVRQVTLAYNPHEAPHAVLQASLEDAFRARHAPTVWLVAPDALEGAPDVGEWLRRHGSQKWSALLQRRTHAFAWKARTILLAHWGPQGIDAEAAAAVLAEAEAFDRSIRRDAARADLELHFWPAIQGVLHPVADEPPAQDRLTAVAVPRSGPASAPEPPPRAATPAASQPPGEPHNEPPVVKAEPAPVQRPRTSDYIPSVADDLDDHERWLRRWRGQPFVGLPQGTLPGLDRATFGLRGLTVLAGPAGAAKSALALQWAWDVLAADPRVCALFVSAKSSRFELLSRLKARVAGLDWSTLVRGSGLTNGANRSGQAAHFTDEERARLRKAESLMAGRGKRMIVLDLASPNSASMTSWQACSDRLKARTETRRRLIVVDSLQSWANASRRSARHAGNVPVDAYFQRLRRLRDELPPDDAIVAICEHHASGQSPDADGSGESSMARAESVPNGGRAAAGGLGAAGYLADAAFWLRPLSESEIVARLQWQAGRQVYPAHDDREALTAARSAAALAETGLAYLRLDVLGGRDGWRSTSFDLLHRPERSDFEELPTMTVDEPASPASATTSERPAHAAEIAAAKSPAPKTAEPPPAARQAATDRRRGFTWGPYGPDSG